jgi:hypothetical protein
MKKRLRKKLHRGEFQQYGISIMILVSTESVEAVLNTITDIANAHKLLFCGGGLGQFILPSEEYGELKVPSKVEFLITSIALGSEMPSDCIIGYFINPTEQKISVDTAGKVKSKLEKALKADLKINCRIPLWT